MYYELLPYEVSNLVKRTILKISLLALWIHQLVSNLVKRTILKIAIATLIKLVLSVT